MSRFVAIDAQHLLAHLRQGFGDACAQRGFAGAALAGQNRDHFAHNIASFVNYHTE